MAVVDRLEAVDVDQQDTDGLAAPRRTRGLVHQRLLQRAAIAQPVSESSRASSVRAGARAGAVAAARGCDLSTASRGSKARPQEDLCGDGDRPLIAHRAIDQRSSAQRPDGDQHHAARRGGCVAEAKMAASRSPSSARARRRPAIARPRRARCRRTSPQQITPADRGRAVASARRRLASTPETSTRATSQPIAGTIVRVAITAAVYTPPSVQSAVPARRARSMSRSS